MTYTRHLSNFVISAFNYLGKRIWRPKVFALALIAISGLAVSASEDHIVLTSDSIGPMPLKVGMPISTDQIAKYFPAYKVTSEILSGDSPDYHQFTVSTCDGYPLISLISYIQDDSLELGADVRLDEVVLLSPMTKDEFGISPGSSIAEALQVRGDLEFGAGHMDNYLGRDQIWYLFEVADMHGMQVSKEHAIESNPSIDVISWPVPRWR